MTNGPTGASNFSLQRDGASRRAVPPLKLTLCRICDFGMIRQLLDGMSRWARTRSQLSRDAFAPGDLVSVVTDDGQFGVMKVLAVDSGGVHARLYVQRFTQRPRRANLAELSTAPFGKGHDNPFSIGHMPLSYSSFGGWQPELITRGSVVAEDELEGYHMWQVAKGDYF